MHEALPGEQKIPESRESEYRPCGQPRQCAHLPWKKQDLKLL